MKLIYPLSVGPINSNWIFFSSRYSLDFRGLSEKRQHIFGPFGPLPPCQQFYSVQFRNFIKLCQHFTNLPPPPRCWCHLWKPPNKLWGKQCDFSKWHFFTDFSPTVSIYITAQTVLYSFFYLMRALENCGTTSITVSSLE